jgi:CRP/FNR family transcriptional regulator, cyclic AMP receptor protein
MDIHPFWGNPFSKSRANLKNEIDFISTVPVFDLLSDREKRRVYGLLHVRKFSRDEIVFRQGDPGVGLYIVREGNCEVFLENSDLTCKKIAVMDVGDFFGEISLLNECPRSATVISTTETKLLGLFRHDLLELMDSSPRLGLHLVYRLSQIVAERLRLLDEMTGV